MAEILSPVKEECVKHGHELNVSECHGADSCPLGWVDMGMSLAWLSTKPVRFGVNKIVNPLTGDYLKKVDPIIEKLQVTFPAMTDEKSEETVCHLKSELSRQVRHRMRSAIRSNAGRGLLQTLDKMIALSENMIEYLESRRPEKGTDPTSAKSDLRRDSPEPGSDSALGMDESPGECDKSTMTSSTRVVNSATNTGKQKQNEWLWMLLAKPVHLWVGSLKLVRRYLYRVGRLRRCKSSRTPAKDIAKRPMISPRKRHQQSSSFSSMIKYALSPIAGKPKRSSLEHVKDVKAKELRVPLKRKHYQVTPYSTGDDSDNDTGRIVDNYFQLQDYDSEEDSDYEWHSSDEYLTSDSEEYRTDSDEETNLKKEADWLLSSGDVQVKDKSARRVKKTTFAEDQGPAESGKASGPQTDKSGKTTLTNPPTAGPKPPVETLKSPPKAAEPAPKPAKKDEKKHTGKELSDASAKKDEKKHSGKELSDASAKKDEKKHSGKDLSDASAKKDEKKSSGKETSDASAKKDVKKPEDKDMSDSFEMMN